MKLIMGFAFAAIIMSQLLLVFNLAAPVISSPPIPQEPPVGESGGFFDQVRAILEAVVIPMRYIVNSVGAFVQFLTFQIEDIPAPVNTILVTPFYFGFGYIILRLIRGGG